MKFSKYSKFQIEFKKKIAFGGVVSVHVLEFMKCLMHGIFKSEKLSFLPCFYV